jgi:hypothetical protein
MLAWSARDEKAGGKNKALRRCAGQWRSRSRDARGAATPVRGQAAGGRASRGDEMAAGRQWSVVSADGRYGERLASSTGR